MAGDGAGSGVHQETNLVADLASEHPPLLFPCADPAAGPGVAVLLSGVVNTPGHSAEGVADEIGSAVKNGEFFAKLQEVGFGGHGKIVRPFSPQRHRGAEKNKASRTP